MTQTGISGSPYVADKRGCHGFIKGKFRKHRIDLVFSGGCLISEMLMHYVRQTGLE